MVLEHSFPLLSYDSMGRAQTLTSGGSTVTSATYGTANELLSLNGQTFTYNTLFQLTRIQGNGIDISYAYSASQNNGKFTSQTDNVSGEQVVYTYDSLQRLATALTTPATGVPQWGQRYTYDRWGNLTDQDVYNPNNDPNLAAPTYHVAVDAHTNRTLYSGGFDANGNATDGINSAFDVENRLAWMYASSNIVNYGYAADNKRVFKALLTTPGGVPTLSSEEVYFYSVTGQKLGTYSISGDQSPAFTQTSTNVWFGGRLIQRNGSTVAPDRLGSIGKYYPYGQEKGSGNPANGVEKFATYTRDAETGLDYADQRYHGPGTGRFLSPDPFAGSRRPQKPGSWNRYAYVGGDPVNRRDPSGLCDVVVGGITQSSTSSLGLNLFSTAIGATQAFPYAGGPSVPEGLAAVFGQGVYGASSETL
ncbi:MAG: RHS repeat-associated core domain-containing protein, partial [Bryobacteraceae bacterium]